ncbi:hypothetical protein Hdeb2414_s0015g00438301 [Helianthus debilis subsp. tardiflorus]
MRWHGLLMEFIPFHMSLIPLLLMVSLIVVVFVRKLGAFWFLDFVWFISADRVFGPATTSRQVYDVPAHHVVNGAMEGVNGAVAISVANPTDLVKVRV